MSNTYGSPMPGRHAGGPYRAPVRYVVLIDGDTEGTRLARLFLADRLAAGEFDAGAEEVQQMLHGLVPEHGASGREWDKALAGHSAAERAGAQVFMLDI